MINIFRKPRKRNGLLWQNSWSKWSSYGNVVKLPGLHHLSGRGDSCSQCRSLVTSGDQLETSWRPLETEPRSICPWCSQLSQIDASPHESSPGVKTAELLSEEEIQRYSKGEGASERQKELVKRYTGKLYPKVEVEPFQNENIIHVKQRLQLPQIPIFGLRFS